MLEEKLDFSKMSEEQLAYVKTVMDEWYTNVSANVAGTAYTKGLRDMWLYSVLGVTAVYLVRWAFVFCKYSKK